MKQRAIMICRPDGIYVREARVTPAKKGESSSLAYTELPVLKFKKTQIIKFTPSKENQNWVIDFPQEFWDLLREQWNADGLLNSQKKDIELGQSREEQMNYVD